MQNSVSPDIDRHDRRIEGISARVGELEKSHARIEVTMSHLQTSVNVLDTKVVNLGKNVAEMQGDEKEMIAEIKSKPDIRRWLSKNWSKLPTAALLLIAAIYGANIIYNTAAYKDATRAFVK